MSEPTYVLTRGNGDAPEAPALDPEQQRVVTHPGGPLLVLAGPGTGKTTTLVEAIVDRVERRGASPERVVALTFSRKAAEQLRDRVTARLGRTVSASLCSTFHSFAYALVRRFVPAELYDAPLRLLSSPEQDVLIAEILRGEGAGLWPRGMRQAVPTRGFAREVQGLLARAREQGMDPVDLVALAETTGDPVWRAAGVFLQRYLVVLDNLSAIDYPDLIRRATALAEQHREELRGMVDHVFVDEYQDTDPSQVELLRVLAGDGRDLVAVGDPHQSIYGFRGADVRGILEFPTEFPQTDGQRAPVVVLPRARRFGPVLLEASQRVASRLPLSGSIPSDLRRSFLSPEPDETAVPGRVSVTTFASDRAEAEHIADRLRRAHLEDGIEWGEMAVLVRSGRSTIPGLRRALVAAGVPVEVAADDTPLVREPAVSPLLAALAAVVDLHEEDPTSASYLHPDRVLALLESPLGGLDATDVRAAGRALRAAEQRAAVAADRPAASSAVLLRSAVLDPEAATRPGEGGSVGQGTRAALRRVGALGRLLARARARLDAGATAEEVLWTLWDGTSWPRRLRDRATAGGPGARLAHRDLDAVCALFDTAARAEDQRLHTSVPEFLETLRAQQIPADTLAERGVRGNAVRLLTAHRSKGLEWRLVVVAHVQEEVWPDLRRRATLLPGDRLDGAQIAPPTSVREMLAEERRLFYVALTRAREEVLVTAVAAPDDDGEQPSRFLGDLGLQATHVRTRPARPMSLAGVVAELRQVLTDPSSPEPLRDAAARRLASLASLEVEGRPVAPQADPGEWWGIRGQTLAPQPLRSPDEPITLRASTLESLRTCSLNWFLEREAGGSQRSTTAQGFGLLVHTLADRIARGEAPGSPEDVEELMRHVERVWDELSFRTPWSSERERVEVRRALVRLTDWGTRERGRTLLTTEQEVAATLTLPDGEQVRLRGRVDRLERDEQGRVVVVDLKTNKTPPTNKSVQENDQLGFYQLAVAAGAVEELAPGADPGGAELVQLRGSPGDVAKVQQQEALEPNPDEPTWIEEHVAQAVRVLRTEDFRATPGDHCRYCAFHQLCPAQTSGTVLS